MISLPIKTATQGALLFKDVGAGFIQRGVYKESRSGGSKPEWKPTVCQPPIDLKEEEYGEEDDEGEDEEEEEEDQDDYKE